MPVTSLLDPAGVSAEAVLGAMRAVALEHGGPGLTEMDRETIGSAATIVLGLGEIDVDALAPVDPAGLASATGDAEEAARAIRMLSVMSLADGEIDAEKTALVRAYADALGVEADYLDILTEAAAGEIAQAAACIVRKNAESFPHLDSSRLSISAVAPFFPTKKTAPPTPSWRPATRRSASCRRTPSATTSSSTSTPTASSSPATRTGSPRASPLPTTARTC
ncbi:MAG TPA: hypothetical protein VJ204_00450 [Solirubrobacterales bacterium]|nr:hypothetical protein [Solirubrobacterales bacterium]